MSDRPKAQSYKYVAPADLKPWPDNPRVISAEAFDALCRALQDDPEMMQARPLVALMDGTVIAGNMRLRAATHLGWTHVPVVYRDLDRPTARKVALRDNQQFGEWQEDELAEMLHELAEQGTDLAALGFDASSAKKILDAARGGDGGGEGIDPAEQFGVIVVCSSEAEQEQAYRDLQQSYGAREGFAVKVVVV